MARIVVAGSGAVGASVAYHFALLGADDVIVAERGKLVSGSTSRAMGGVRQQFSTPEEVVLARESIDFLARLGPALFRQVGYLFLATTEEGLAGLEERLALQNELGVPVERVDPSVVRGLAVDDVLGATCCWTRRRRRSGRRRARGAAPRAGARRRRARDTRAEESSVTCS